MRCIILLFYLLVGGSGNATEYYVKDADEIEDVMAYAIPGDVLIMANGVWTDQRIEFEGEGAEADSITLRAETPGRVILTGKSNLRISGRYLVVKDLWFLNGESPSGGVIEFRGDRGSAHHCRLTQTAVLNYNPGNEFKDYKWISLYGTNDRVDHCFLEVCMAVIFFIVVYVMNR